MSSPCAPRSILIQEPTPELCSSPPPTSAATTAGSRKPKRPPPITPKRFTRFFTPRHSKDVSSRTSLTSSGRQLQDITRSALNRNRATRTTPRKTVNFVDIENHMQTPTAAHVRGSHTCHQRAPLPCHHRRSDHATLPRWQSTYSTSLIQKRFPYILRLFGD
ncbi:hypothetical protein P3342_004847 [Pyrenophora teres f. teres]|nr:hypothetical protein P3342_004847 [Pyrenophora teres f. teres]